MTSYPTVIPADICRMVAEYVLPPMEIPTVWVQTSEHSEEQPATVRGEQVLAWMSLYRDEPAKDLLEERLGPKRTSRPIEHVNQFLFNMQEVWSMDQQMIQLACGGFLDRFLHYWKLLIEHTKTNSHHVYQCQWLVSGYHVHPSFPNQKPWNTFNLIIIHQLLIAGDLECLRLLEANWEGLVHGRKSFMPDSIHLEAYRWHLAFSPNESDDRVFKYSIYSMMRMGHTQLLEELLPQLSLPLTEFFDLMRPGVIPNTQEAKQLLAQTIPDAEPLDLARLTVLLKTLAFDARNWEYKWVFPTELAEAWLERLFELHPGLPDISEVELSRLIGWITRNRKIRCIGLHPLDNWQVIEADHYPRYVLRSFIVRLLYSVWFQRGVFLRPQLFYSSYAQLKRSDLWSSLQEFISAQVSASLEQKLIKPTRHFP